MYNIDFVIPWVDGDDPQWRSVKNKYERELLPPKSNLEESVMQDDANADCRFRELGFLRYWFRGVEKFAPWVNKVFFVTCGQKPEWLNPDHPKLVLVNHKDYIPEKYLPTFNSITIELNLHRIEGLSEHFVYFNDDIFLLRPISPDVYFRDGNPVLPSSLKYPNYLWINNWSHQVFNDYCLVNKKHDMGKSIWKNRDKWFNIRALGFHRAFRNYLCYLANKTLPVGNFDHLAAPNLKSTLVDAWENCFDELDHSSSFKFRSDEQLNQSIFCVWNQALGSFYPCKYGERGRRIHIKPENANWISNVIKNQLIPQVCLNDTNFNSDPEYCSEIIVDAFKLLLPDRSQFELF